MMSASDCPCRPCNRPARARRSSGWVGLISSTGFETPDAVGHVRRACVRAGGRDRCSGATRQAGAFGRADPRRARRRRPISSVCFMKAKSVATSAEGGSSGGRRRRLRRAGSALMSAAPWVTDLNGLPSKPSAVETQKASTGSGSSRTSMPRARKPSSCGLCGKALEIVAEEIIDRRLVRPQRGDIVGERAPAVADRGRGRKARELEELVAPLGILVEPFLQYGAEILPDLLERLRVVFGRLGQLLQHAIGDRRS